MVTITTNKHVFAGPEGVILKGQSKLVPEDYADTLQEGWILASRSDAPDFKDPEGLPDDQAVALAKSQWGLTAKGKATMAREAADKAALDAFNQQLAAQQAAAANSAGAQAPANPAVNPASSNQTGAK